MKKIKYLFWNIYKKNLFSPIKDLIIENGIDILALVEAENLDKDHLIQELHISGEQWKNIEILSKGEICLIVKNHINVKVVKEEKNFSCYKIQENDEIFLLFVAHLSSAMYRDEGARSRRAINISNVVRKIEEEEFSGKEYKCIVVGDFNLQPYSAGIAGIDGFNATMSVVKAKTISREVDKEKRFFYFNPIWKLMGDNKTVQGTYYNESDQQDLSMFWYAFDEVLIRPYFIDRFVWDSFCFIERTVNYEFVKKDKIDKNNFSDHLPLTFEIK